LEYLKSFRNELTILLVTRFTGYALFYKISISEMIYREAEGDKEVYR